MNQIFKNFWAHRKQNVWIIIEIALAAFFSFISLDHLVVITYDAHLTRLEGDFEREHLAIGKIGRIVNANDTIAENLAEEDEAAFYQRTLANVYSVRDQIRALPEVQHVSLTDDFFYSRTKSFSSEADSTLQCEANHRLFLIHEPYFETLGLTPIEGSPSAAVLSECPVDGVVITRSMAMALFGTDQVVGRRIVEWDFSDEAIQKSGRPEIKDRFTIAGVVKDFRFHPDLRYGYSVLESIDRLPDTSPNLLIRLRPEVNAEAFVNSIKDSIATPLQTFRAGDRILATIEPYTKEDERRFDNGDLGTYSFVGTFIVLLLINVALGTLGTFWLQIRKRTEDIGIMRSFGAKRRHIFGMIWKEAALLTLIACVLGQLVWMQFALNDGLAQGRPGGGTGQEIDWVTQFWPHFLIICVLQFLLMLAIVTLGILIPTLLAMYKRPVEALQYE